MTKHELRAAIDDICLTSMFGADTIALVLRDVMDEYEAMAEEDSDMEDDDQ